MRAQATAAAAQAGMQSLPAISNFNPAVTILGIVFVTIMKRSKVKAR